MVIFRNGRLIFPDAIRDGFEVVAHDGKIVAVRDETNERADDVIDLEGNYLAPGFIDLHIHGAVGRDTMEATPEAFRVICDYHATGGTTSLLLTTATAPIEKILRVLQAARDCSRPAQSGRLTGATPESLARPRRQSAVATAQILGVHLEGPFISKQKPGAQMAEFIRDPSPELTRQLLEFQDVIRLVTLAPELPGALSLIEQLRGRNIRVSGGHSNAWDEEARAAFDHGMRQVTHTFNCMSSARRRGPYRVAGLLEFAMSEPQILCELIADGHHVLPTLMKMLYRAKGAAGIALVTDATAGAGLPNESHFQLGGIDCVVKDGVCFLANGSALAGSATRMIDLVRTMLRSTGISLPEAIQMATANPARALGLEERKGFLKAGADADFAVISPEFEVVRTVVAGSATI